MPIRSIKLLIWLVFTGVLFSETLATEQVDEQAINKKWESFEELSLVDAAGALTKVQQAYAKLPESTSKYERVMAKLAVITIQMRLNQLPDALKNINDIYPLSLETGHHRNTGELLARRGRILLKNQEFNKALLAIDEALAMFERINDKPLIGISYNIRGQILLALGNKAGALDDLLRSYDIVRTENDATKTASALSAIANIYVSNSEYEKAIEYFKLALSYLDHDKQKLFVSIVKGNIGSASIQLNDLDEAKTYLSQAITLTESLGDKVGSASSKLQLARVYKLDNQVYKSIGLYREVLAVFESINDVSNEFVIYTALAQIFSELRNLGMATSYLKKAELNFPEVKVLETKMSFHRIAADIYSQTEDYKKASDSLRKYISFLKEKFKNDHNERFNQLQVQFNTEQKEIRNKLLEQENKYKTEMITQQKAQYKLLYTIVTLIIVFSLVLAFGLIKQVKIKHEFAQLALTDELTKAPNRRAILERADFHIKLASQKKYSLIIGIIDLDDFKVVNDTYGHDAGDEVLKSFYRFTKQAIREPDELGRLGGEEWLLILPNIDLDQLDTLFNRADSTR